ncbi:hypothetical protein [Nostoc sp. WHI]|uniref:hypothetical protein n=1 Tax=Nostoc sp. WHI TaxID=2650611 RepID=UPI0018C70A7B|nr:hypothetical protein [Nostoc sp. WHI]
MTNPRTSHQNSTTNLCGQDCYRWLEQTDLDLYDRSQSPLTVSIVNLKLIPSNNDIIECRLSLNVSCELYHRIDTEILFNLKPQIRSPFSNGDLLPQSDIQLEVTLHPNLLPLC